MKENIRERMKVGGLGGMREVKERSNRLFYVLEGYFIGTSVAPKRTSNRQDHYITGTSKALA